MSRSGNMNHVLQVSIVVKPENVDAFMAKLWENALAARQEPGCLQFEVLVDPTDPTRVTLFEVYKDEAAFEAHQQAPAFKKYLAEARTSWP